MRLDSEKYRILKREVIDQNKGLFWDQKNLDNMSTELIVERILNLGEFDSILKMIDIVGIDKTAKIFSKKISRDRHNFSPKTANYFKLFFKKYAQRNIKL
jgi:hypothetical protein